MDENLNYESPLGLNLQRTPSFMNLVESLSQTRNSPQSATSANGEASVSDSGGAWMSNSGSSSTSKNHHKTQEKDKVKASHFSLLLLRIGSFEKASRHEGDLVGKIYYAKKLIVWEILDSQTKRKQKIQFKWQDISAIRAIFRPNEPDVLEIELNQVPHYFSELSIQPRKHSKWKAQDDFTRGQAPRYRRHYLECPNGTLAKHYEKLLHCDPSLLALSRRPFPSCENPLFNMIMEGHRAQHDHHLIRPCSQTPLGFGPVLYSREAYPPPYGPQFGVLASPQPVYPNFISQRWSLDHCMSSNSLVPAPVMRPSFEEIRLASLAPSYLGCRFIVDNGIGGHFPSNRSQMWNNSYHDATNTMEWQGLPSHAAQLPEASFNQNFRPTNQHRPPALLDNGFTAGMLTSHVELEEVLRRERHSTVELNDHQMLQHGLNWPNNLQQHGTVSVYGHGLQHGMNYTCNFPQQATEFASNQALQHDMNASSSLLQQDRIMVLAGDHVPHNAEFQPQHLEEINEDVYGRQQHGTVSVYGHGLQHGMNYPCNFPQQATEFASNQALQHDMNASSSLLQQDRIMVLAGDHVPHNAEFQPQHLEEINEDVYGRQQHGTVSVYGHGLQHGMNYPCNFPQQATEFASNQALQHDMNASSSLLQQDRIMVLAGDHVPHNAEFQPQHLEEINEDVYGRQQHGTVSVYGHGLQHGMNYPCNFPQQATEFASNQALQHDMNASSSLLQQDRIMVLAGDHVPHNAEFQPQHLEEINEDVYGRQPLIGTRNCASIDKYIFQRKH